MNVPALTVAIPTYNGQRHLAEALRSVLGQTGVEFDLLVSDDRSDDETLRIVRAEAGERARIIVNSDRLGLAGNWNQCVAQSPTPFVAVFHQDDVMRPGHLAAHVAAFGSDERLGLVCSAAEVIDADGKDVPKSIVGRGGLGPVDRSFGPGEVVPELARGNPLRCSAVTLRAAAHADVGGFDPSYRYVVDWDCWLRIGRRWGVRWLARPSVAIRWHPASETHTFKTGTTDLDETARLLDDLFSRDGKEWLDVPQRRREADRGLARAFLSRAHEAVRSGDPRLANTCFRRAVSLWPGVLRALARDPRLAIQLAAAGVAPGLARRWLARRTPRKVSEKGQTR